MGDKGQFNTDIEIILGTNKDEGLLYLIAQLLSPEAWNSSALYFNTTGPQLLFNIANPDDITNEDIEKAYQVMEYYIGSLDNFNQDHIDQVATMFTDASFLFGIHNGIRYFTKHDVTVYQYLLTYQGVWSFLNTFGIPTQGVCHADDLFYIFEFGLNFNENDEFNRHLMTTAWTNFAKYGDPTPPNSDFEWTPHPVGQEHHYFDISGPSSTMTTSQDIQ